MIYGVYTFFKKKQFLSDYPNDNVSDHFDILDIEIQIF